MTRRKAIENILIAGAVSYLKPLPAENRDFIIKSDVRLVLLDVSVKDRKGGWAPGLSKTAFTVFENGKRQAISVFANNDIPVTVGLIVDNSQSMSPKRKEVLAAATTFIEESNRQDEMFVLNFNDTVRAGLPEGQPFSSSLDQLRAALERGHPEGRTALNDAVVAGIKHLKQGRRDKKALIVLSDGGDNASTHGRRELQEMIESNLATIYTIGLFDTGDMDRDPGILKRLARVSGGVAYFPGASEALVQTCRDIARDIRTRYTIGYSPAAENGGSLRRIHVTADADGSQNLIARTRQSYRYETPDQNR